MRALVCGAGGFIGGHLVQRLKRDGHWVRGVDIKMHAFAPLEDIADEFLLLDLRYPWDCREALEGGFHEVYQLAADMGGIGYIERAECDIMRNNALINAHMAHEAVQVGVPRYFFSSSVCVYRDLALDEPPLTETDAYPALPHNEYGWEKLYAERIALAYARHYPMQVRVARFQNCYGPEGAWRGGREKAPAALCRKAAMAEDGTSIRVWGDGTAVRAYTYVDDVVDAVLALTRSDLEGPVTVGGDEYVTVDELAQTIIVASGKQLGIEHVEGPMGVQARNFDKSRLKSLGWEARVPLHEGIARTYAWIEEQVRRR